MTQKNISNCERSLANVVALVSDYNDVKEGQVRCKAEAYDAWQEFASAKDSWGKLAAIGRGIFYNFAIKTYEQRSEQLSNEIESATKEHSALDCMNMNIYKLAEEIRKTGIMSENLDLGWGWKTGLAARETENSSVPWKIEDGDTVMPDREAIRTRLAVIKANLNAEGLEEGTNEYNERLAKELYSLTNEFYTPQESTALEALRGRESEMDSTLRMRVLFDLFEQVGLNVEYFNDK